MKLDELIPNKLTYGSGLDGQSVSSASSTGLEIPAEITVVAAEQVPTSNTTRTSNGPRGANNGEMSQMSEHNDDDEAVAGEEEDQLSRRLYWGNPVLGVVCDCTHLAGTNPLVKIRFDIAIKTDYPREYVPPVITRLVNKYRIMFNTVTVQMHCMPYRYRDTDDWRQFIDWAEEMFIGATTTAIPQASEAMSTAFINIKQQMMLNEHNSNQCPYENHIVKITYQLILESAGLMLITVAQILNQLTLSSRDDDSSWGREGLKRIKLKDFAETKADDADFLHDFVGRPSESFKDNNHDDREGTLREVNQRLNYVQNVMMPSVESAMGDLLSDVGRIRNADEDVEEVPEYIKWSGKTILKEWSKDRLPRAMFHLMSVGSTLLTLSHVKDMDSDVWKMVMGGIRDGGKPGWAWNQVKRNTCPICGNQFAQGQNHLLQEACAVNLPR